MMRARPLIPGQGFILAATTAVALALAGPATAATTTITSSGPLTNIGISEDLNCSVNHTGDESGEFFGDTACGTFVALGTEHYGPAGVPAGNSGSPPYTPVSQSAVTGAGTSGSPYTIVTVVDLGTSGLRLTETDSYVVGEESYRTDVQIHNSGSSSVEAILYRAADCYLQNSDTGFGSVDTATGAVACVNAMLNGSEETVPGTRIEEWFPLSTGSSYYESGYFSVWEATVSGAAFPDTCACTEDIDNGAGLSWNITIPAGGTVTRSNLVTFSPLGHSPLSTTKTADSATASAGGGDGYTIKISNPNANGVTLGSITDTLPAGFSYTAGSSSGATTADPTVSGESLTWAGPITVPAASGDNDGTVSLHFNVTAADTSGTYFNNAGGSASEYTVVPTGDTAPVTVSGVGPTPTTTSTSLSGEGRSGGSITVKEGAAVSDSATLGGTNAPSATGSVTYKVYSDSGCTKLVAEAGTVTVSAGSVPASEAKTLTPAGTYYWQASYGGDSANEASKSTCGSEVENVEAPAAGPTPTTTSTSLSGEGRSGGSITVKEGAAVSDSATLGGTNASSATGSVTYKVYSDSGCTKLVAEAGTVTVSAGSVPASEAKTLTPAGTYYWQASYGGDSANEASKSTCGSEVENVEAPAAGPTPTTTSTSLSGEGRSGGSITVKEGAAVSDSATLGGTNASSATGSVTYKVYSDSGCTKLVAEAGTVTVSAGSVPASEAKTLTPAGTYYWQASYGGDSANEASKSTCGSEVENVEAPAGGQSPTSLRTWLCESSSGDWRDDDWGHESCGWFSWCSHGWSWFGSWFGHSGDRIYVSEGASVRDHAALGGRGAATATGTVTYNVYSDADCDHMATGADTVSLEHGWIPPSASVRLRAGVYYWQATYSGDSANAASSSECGSEVETVVGDHHHW